MFISEGLTERHDRSRFRSGQAQLDTWLADHSLAAAARGTGRTFVWHTGDGVVVGYYTISAHLILRDDLPRSLAHGNPGRIPAVLLARLALDQSLQHQGLGSDLLHDALRRIVLATATVAARFVVVDAIDDNAAGFYQAHGFRSIPDTSRLIQKLSNLP